MKRSFLAVSLGGLLAVTAFAQQDDPPSRVARLNYTNGNVSMEPAGVDEWSPAVVNRPFSTGDYLYTDEKSVAELHLDDAIIRMGQYTSFGFLNVSDTTAQLKLTEGDLYVRLRHFGSDQAFEVDTPNAAINLLRDGIYRIHVDADANTSEVTTREGQAEITGGGQAFTLTPGQMASLSGTDQLAYQVDAAPDPDSFDQWSQERDAHEDRVRSSRYVPPDVIGYEDLDDYGEWSPTPQYGAVWYPTSVPVGWAPYHVGHWAWVEPWGWTWVDSAPWGFAPFHYGRWAYIGSRWGWCPGPIGIGYAGPRLRPVYAPAMVAWFGGAHWGVGVSVGGPSVGWVPLGWGEVYTPPYAVSRRYFNNVNINNTTIVRNVNITNVYNNVYVNKTVYNQNYVNVHAPHAVMSMPQRAFATARPVNQAGMVVSPAELSRIRPQQAAMIAPGVAPTRNSVSSTLGAAAAHPPARVMQRQVFARSTPPAAPAPFAVRETYLQQHAGQLHNFEAMHRSVAATARVQPVSSIRTVAPVQPSAVRVGERVGNPQLVNGNGRFANTPAAQPNRNGANGSFGQPRPLPTVREAGQPRPAPTVREPVQPRVPQQTPAVDQQRPVTHGMPPNMRPEYNGRNGTQPPAAMQRGEPNGRESVMTNGRSSVEAGQGNPAVNRPRYDRPQPIPEIQQPQHSTPPAAPERTYQRPSMDRPVTRPSEPIPERRQNPYNGGERMQSRPPMERPQVTHEEHGTPPARPEPHREAPASHEHQDHRGR